MARYRNSQDLGIFIGAQFINLPRGEGQTPIPGIFIPAAINGIDVKADTREDGKRNVSGFRAFITTQQRALSGKYVEAVKQGLMRRGEPITPYNVPAYQLCYTLPEEKRVKIRAALAERLKKEHPEYAAQSDTPGTELARAVSTMMPFQMGDSYLMEEASPAAPAAPAFKAAPMAQGVSGYTPVTSFGADDTWKPADDDLPF